MILPTTSCKLYRLLMAILLCLPTGVVVAGNPDNSVNNAPMVTTVKPVSTKLHLPSRNTAIEITSETGCTVYCDAVPLPG